MPPIGARDGVSRPAIFGASAMTVMFAFGQSTFSPIVDDTPMPLAAYQQLMTEAPCD
jgi:hypothetical protein